MGDHQSSASTIQYVIDKYMYEVDNPMGYPTVLGLMGDGVGYDFKRMVDFNHLIILANPNFGSDISRVRPGFK